MSPNTLNFKACQTITDDTLHRSLQELFTKEPMKTVFFACVNVLPIETRS